MFLFHNFQISEGMADYQHVIPVHADIALRKKRSWIEMDEPLAGETCIFQSFYHLQMNL